MNTMIAQLVHESQNGNVHAENLLNEILITNK